MTKRYVSGTVVTLTFLLVSTPVFAAWHYSTITLPRNGWWYSTERPATGNTQRTQVTEPEYKVVSNIDSSIGSKLSSNKTHAAGITTTNIHENWVNEWRFTKGSLTKHRCKSIYKQGLFGLEAIITK